MEKDLGLLFITSSNFHLFNRTDFEQYLVILIETVSAKLEFLHPYKKASD